MLAEMEDDPHAMVCRVSHDGARVTAVEADFRHYPLTTCPGAGTPLRELIGLPIDITTADLFAGGAGARELHAHAGPGLAGDASCASR